MEKSDNGDDKIKLQIQNLLKEDRGLLYTDEVNAAEHTERLQKMFGSLLPSNKKWVHYFARLFHNLNILKSYPELGKFADPDRDLCFDNFDRDKDPTNVFLAYNEVKSQLLDIIKEDDCEEKIVVLNIIMQSGFPITYFNFSTMLPDSDKKRYRVKMYRIFIQAAEHEYVCVSAMRKIPIN